jgi:hypothetical protein
MREILQVEVREIKGRGFVSKGLCFKYLDDLYQYVKGSYPPASQTMDSPILRVVVEEANPGTQAFWVNRWREYRKGEKK